MVWQEESGPSIGGGGPGPRHSLAASPRFFVTGFRAWAWASQTRFGGFPFAKALESSLPVPETPAPGPEMPREAVPGHRAYPGSAQAIKARRRLHRRPHGLPPSQPSRRVLRQDVPSSRNCPSQPPAVLQTFRSTRRPPSLLGQSTGFPGQSMPAAGTSRISSPPPHSPAQFVGLLNRSS